MSSWAGETDINSRSIGIEIVNPGHEFGYRDFPLRQMAAVISLCKSIVARRGPFPPERVLAHSDVAPERKEDPGEKFPWACCTIPASAIGCGRRRSMSRARGSARATTARRCGGCNARCTSYGYGIEESGRYDETTREVVTAFQRHFRPARVDGVADASTVRTLRALIETRPTDGGMINAPASSAAGMATAECRQGALEKRVSRNSRNTATRGSR